MTEPSERLLEVRDLVVEFPLRGGGRVHAVSGVDFDLHRGETLGVVGESGCGKSTLARAVLQVPPPTAGTVRFEGTDLTVLSREQMRAVRPRLQMVFQDPISSLNPRRRVRDIVAEPLDIWQLGGPRERRTRVADVLADVGLDHDTVADRRPGELSGGQCQRVSLARALVLDPHVIVCDEVLSALDVSVQAQILNLLEDAKERYHLTLLFIAHDLAVVRSISDRVAVMYLGKLCEIGSADDIYGRPAHPYTAALVDSIPLPDPSHRRTRTARPLAGELPSPIDPPSGCRFRTRCPRAEARCAAEEPTLRQVGDGQLAACHFPV
ncbi:ABC transporter ATP-binding protein [Pseudonocardia nigra]|uniref:ABC transporter ATP-binding protein n=1 Tax=Pseudonocardia nigra TaxID=1921578 RepID=UPI001C5CDA9F|nr:oligopeptide/dipeptide ABC transporter ATP-binding protein [Pseudonocardia nigra]